MSRSTTPRSVPARPRRRRGAPGWLAGTALQSGPLPGSGSDNPALQAIWDAVALIPHGCAATYGSVARAAGLPGRARQAGYALRVAPPDMNLPWHRVVGAGGRIAFPPSSRPHREQARRLRAEGVTVQAGRVAARFLIDPAQP